MRDDISPPNLGTSEMIVTPGMINRMIRTIEQALERMMAVGRIRVTVANYRGFSVASLPAKALPGDVAYALNGRKNGEGAGVGTGVLVFHDGSNWIACDSGQTVSD
jgi:hypothetical protein